MPALDIPKATLLRLPDLYLSSVDAARFIGVGVRRFHRLVDENRVKIDGYVEGERRFLLSQLRAFVEAGQPRASRISNDRRNLRRRLFESSSFNRSKSYITMTPMIPVSIASLLQRIVWYEPRNGITVKEIAEATGVHERSVGFCICWLASRNEIRSHH